MNVVVDASVAAKWLLPENDTERAEALLDACKAGRYTPTAPEILCAEVAAVLWKRVRRGLLAPERANFLFERFEGIRPILLPMTGLVRPALKLALRYQHPVYDALYVALSRQLSCDLLTADEELHRIFSPDHPGVRLLRDWRQ